MKNYVRYFGSSLCVAFLGLITMIHLQEVLYPHTINIIVAVGYAIGSAFINYEWLILTEDEYV